jgi:hypothetical protein
MIRQILDRQFFLRHLDAFGPHLDRESELYRSGDPGASDRARQAGVTLDDLQQARQYLAAALPDEAAHESGSEPAFLARHPVSSALQSSLQRHLMERKPEMLAMPAQLGPANDPISDVSLANSQSTDNLFEQFGPVDAGWISVGFASLVSLLRHKRPFTDHPAPPRTISNSARLILLADWGTGVPRARKVGEAARQYLEAAAGAGTEVHVIHLGDVYYSGWAIEYDEHFLPFWPVKPEEAGRYGSWNMNGNHDMYSGGYGYFDHLLKDPRFAAQDQSSYFSLENDFWQILALDSAYDEWDLAGDQADWLARSRQQSPGKKGMLLSHHQPFSDYEPPPDNAKLLKRVQPVLDQHLITAWVWGHEHRCAFYKPVHNLPFGRCIGHSGVPVFASSRDPLPDNVTYEFGDWVLETEPQFARFGFVVIDCQDDQMKVQYVNEDGTPHNFDNFK